MAHGIDKRAWLPSAATALAILACYGTGLIVAALSTLGVAIAFDERVWAGTVSFFALLAVVLIGASSWRRRALPPILVAVAGLALVLWTMWGAYARLVEAIGFALMIVAAILDWRLRPASRTDEGGVAWIEVPDLADRLRRQSALIVIDVRGPEEFVGELGHIEGARNIPLGEVPQRLRELDRFKSDAIILVCKTQMRSAKAAATLADAGFRDVAVLRGGMVEWVRQRDWARGGS